MPMPKLGGSDSGVGSGSWRGCGIFPRAGAMILSSLCGTNISARLAALRFRRRSAAGASAAGGSGRSSGRGAECGAACGFGADSATGCGLCICGEGAPAPGACRDGAEAAADDFAVAAGAAGAFDGTFVIVAAFAIDCADCAFAIGFGEGGGVPAAALDGDDAPTDDGHIATMALFALVIPWPSHDMRPGFCAGAFATTLAAGGFGVVLATGGAGRASGTRIALSGARPRRTAKPTPIETAAGS